MVSKLGVSMKINHTIIFVILLLLMSGTCYSISLNESIELAKKNNLELQSEAEEIQKAEYLYREVRGSLLPQIYLNGSVQKTKTTMPKSVLPGSFSFNDVIEDNNDLANTLDRFLLPSKTIEENSIAAMIKMEQLVFSGGKLINGIRVANKYRNLQKKRYELEEESLVLKVIDSYNQILLVKKVVNVKREAFDLAKNHLIRVQKMNENGFVSEYDMIRAELEVSKLEPEVLEAENMLKLAMNNFKRIIGMDQNADIEISGELSEVELSNDDLEESIKLAQSKRIELYLSSLNVEMMQVKYNAEKGNYLPVVMLTAQAGKFNDASEFTLNQDKFGTQLQAGVVFQIPLFTGLSNNAKIHQAKHELKQAELGKKDAEELIRLEITQNWQNTQTAYHNLSVQKKNLDTAEKAYRIAQSRYDNQVGIQLELLDAQVQLNGAKVSYAQALYQLHYHHNLYKKSLGQKLF